MHGPLVTLRCTSMAAWMPLDTRLGASSKGVDSNHKQPPHTLHTMLCARHTQQPPHTLHTMLCARAHPAAATHLAHHAVCTGTPSSRHTPCTPCCVHGHTQQPPHTLHTMLCARAHPAAATHLAHHAVCTGTPSSRHTPCTPCCVHGHTQQRSVACLLSGRRKGTTPPAPGARAPRLGLQRSTHYAAQCSNCSTPIVICNAAPATAVGPGRKCCRCSCADAQHRICMLQDAVALMHITVTSDVKNTHETKGSKRHEEISPPWWLQAPAACCLQATGTTVASINVQGAQLWS
ncbi:hypothetical protein COO60DRAFT_692390 [Scenedesmus sp. NREL 46B-D3]|nr:hypothetical protein COO60DRAFT_692390 [Scenedesmus sp. NREL 46B-D3]